MEKFNMFVGILSILGVGSSIGQWFYYNNLRFYVYIQKLLSLFTDISFDVTFTYTTNKELRDIYKEIEGVFNNKYGKREYHKEMNLENHKIYNLKNFLVKVQCDSEINGDSEIKEVFINFPKIKATFRSAEGVLEELNELSQMFSNVLGVDKQLYSLNVFYKDGKNPFFGHMIQRFGKEGVKSFCCQVSCEVIMKKEDSVDNRHVSIYKEYANMTDVSFNIVRRVAKYLMVLK